jgi:Asp-tRNA(Asn)/Glu-tRNA(Gln) amidotransferase A subunit family amidase
MIRRLAANGTSGLKSYLMVSTEEIRQTSIRNLCKLISREEIGCEQVSRAFAERVVERERELEAWAHFSEEQAISQAANCDKNVSAQRLRGIPIGIKDSIDTTDMPTSYGSSIYAGHRPQADASCVATLRAAGAVILGKTALTEFAAPFPGRTRNPINIAHTPGGSSSGSAAAVADGMVPAAIGSQTMGSLIRPAAYCGTVGFKPSFGMINKTGMKPQSETFDALGVIARNVDDVALVSAILATVPPTQWEVRLDGAPCIGIFRGPDWSLAEQPAIDALERTIALFAKAGANLHEVSQERILSDAYDTQARLLCFEMARTMAWEWYAHRADISPVLQRWIDIGWQVSVEEYLAGQRTVEAARRYMSDAFQGADVWLTLSAPGEAPRGLEQNGDTAFNRLWSLLHLPAITLPAGKGPNGLPLGVQLVGKFRDDASLISVARWAEEVLSRECSNGLNG